MQGVPSPPPEMTCGFLIQLVFCKKKYMWFVGVEVEVHPVLKNPGSAVADSKILSLYVNRVDAGKQYINKVSLCTSSVTKTSSAVFN